MTKTLADTEISREAEVYVGDDRIGWIEWFDPSFRATVDVGPEETVDYASHGYISRYALMIAGASVGEMRCHNHGLTIHFDAGAPVTLPAGF